MQVDKARRKLEIPAEIQAGLDRRRQELDYELAALQLELNGRRLETARANLEARRRNQEGKIARLQSDLQRIGRQVTSMKMLAPRDGCVVYADNEGEGKPRVGTEVWVGRIVAEIADLGAMKVDAMVPEPDAGRVRVGQRAEVRLDVNPDRLFTGRVTELGRVFHVKSRETPSLVFDAEIALDAPDPNLMRPGMAAEVTILPDDAGPASGAAGRAAR
jgi:multidrug resistance efflux pump